MQRYRINYNWLIGVFVGGLVIAVTAFFVQRWQVERKAGYFLREAEAALAAEDPIEAFQFYSNYVQLRPEEDDARIEMANTAISVIKSPEVTYELIGKALGVIDQTVRTTDDAALRRELAELMMLFGRPQDAIGHYEELLADSPDDNELNVLLARATYQKKDYKLFKRLAFQLIGYDKKTDKFDSSDVSLEGDSDIYGLLTDVLTRRDKDPEFARRVIDEMVAANPESSDAYLRKSIFLSSIDEGEEARELLDKAYELDPSNAAILSRKGLVALSEKNYEEAKAHYELGIQEHEDNPHFYRMLAEAVHRLDQTDEALAVLDRGITKFGEKLAVEIVLYKIELLLAIEDYAAIEDEIEWLTKLNRPDMTPLIDLQRARIKFNQKKWSEASKDLKRIRPLLFERPRYPVTVRPPNFQVMAGAMLGVSYESQGIIDLAKQAYETVLFESPNNRAAKNGLERVMARINPEQKGDGFQLDDVVNSTLALADDEQDWAKVDELVEKVIADNDLPPARQKILRAKVFIKRGMYEEGRDLIRQAAIDAPDDIDVFFSAILLVVSDPEQGPPAALKLLDRLEGRFGRSLRSRAQRADLLVAQKAEDVSEKLRSLADDTEELSEAELSRLYKVLGVKFEQLGQAEVSWEFYEKSLALEPNNLPLRMYMFDFALRNRDVAKMQKAQQTVLDFVKNENDPSYLLTEVKSRILSFGTGKISKEQLADARDLLDKAIAQREQWHELHITYGQLLLLLGEDVNLALEHFDDALKYGPPKSNAVSVQIKLLAEQGLYRQARERMERLPERVRSRLLGKLEAEILIRTGEPADGFVAAEKLAKRLENDLKTQIWFSKIAQNMGKLDVAVTSLRSALEMNPSDPDNWVRLIGLYAEQQKFKEVEAVIREAHLYSDAEFLPLLTGKYYELLSRWQNAEDIYLAAYADQLDELIVARRLADFYLLWSKRDTANIGKAATYINRILRAANEGNAAGDNPHVVWARQKAAQILFAMKDYQASLKAEKLLKQSAVNGVMNNAEIELLTNILISRSDPKSLMQAKQLLSELRASKRLPKKSAIQLARILSRTNQWPEAKKLMLELIAKYRSDAQVRTTYVELLIDQGEFSDAESALRRLQDMSPGGTTMVELSCRLAYEKGDQAQLNRMLKSLLPKMSGAMSAEELRTVLSIAQLATRYDETELAGQLFEVYTARVPSESFRLANFLANHGDGDRAIELMKRLYPDRTDDVVQLANIMMGVRRDVVGDKYDEQLDRLINQSLREDPDSIARQLARAEAFDKQGKYSESIVAYEKLLARDDLPARLRAAAKNNLGFQLALLNQRVDEAEQLVNEAMETFGPVEDMLDTRAVVRIAQGKYDLAIEDMRLALSVGQDPVKYFHLAKAYILAGDGPAATKAWEKALDLGFKKESLPRLEKPGFDEILEKIESVQTQSAKL